MNSEVKYKNGEPTCIEVVLEQITGKVCFDVEGDVAVLDEVKIYHSSGTINGTEIMKYSDAVKCAKREVKKLGFINHVQDGRPFDE